MKVVHFWAELWWCRVHFICPNDLSYNKWMKLESFRDSLVTLPESLVFSTVEPCCWLHKHSASWKSKYKHIENIINHQHDDSVGHCQCTGKKLWICSPFGVVHVLYVWHLRVNPVYSCVYFLPQSKIANLINIENTEHFPWHAFGKTLCTDMNVVYTLFLLKNYA